MGINACGFLECGWYYDSSKRKIILFVKNEIVYYIQAPLSSMNHENFDYIHPLLAHILSIYLYIYIYILYVNIIGPTICANCDILGQ
jgi:hypothetical protein